SHDSSCRSTVRQDELIERVRRCDHWSTQNRSSKPCCSKTMSVRPRSGRSPVRPRPWPPDQSPADLHQRRISRAFVFTQKRPVRYTSVVGPLAYCLVCSLHHRGETDTKRPGGGQDPRKPA